MYFCWWEEVSFIQPFRKVPLPVYPVDISVVRKSGGNDSQLMPHMETFPEMIRSAKKDVWNWKNLQCNHSIGKENHTSLLLWAKSVFQERNIPNPTQKTLFHKNGKSFQKTLAQFFLISHFNITLYSKWDWMDIHMCRSFHLRMATITFTERKGSRDMY